MKKSELTYMVREVIQNALRAEARGMDGMEEPREVRKARLAGGMQARKMFAGKSQEELQRAYLEIEAKASQETDDAKNMFLWGACDAIKLMLKKQGGALPEKPKPSSLF